jgi:amidase
MPIRTRESVLDLWEAARRDVEAAGGQVVEVDHPAVTNYEADRPGAPNIRTRGIVPPGFLDREVLDLAAWAWEDFLRANGDPALHSLADVDGATIFPHPPGALVDRWDTDADVNLDAYPAYIRAHGRGALGSIPELEAGLRGLEETRRLDLEAWMDRLGLDAVVFPALADVGAADADVNEESAARAWSNGVWVANGNLVPRHLGIPTVTVPMGTMADIGMPVGLTIAGRAYDDPSLLRLACAFEATGPRRTEPPCTPRIP